MPCSVPNTENGVYHHFEGTVAPQDGVAHGEVLTLTCLPGFQLMGPDSLRCWYGDWAVDNLPECVPSTYPLTNFGMLIAKLLTIYPKCA